MVVKKKRKREKEAKRKNYALENYILLLATRYVEYNAAVMYSYVDRRTRERTASLLSSRMHLNFAPLAHTDIVKFRLHRRRWFSYYFRQVSVTKIGAPKPSKERSKGAQRVVICVARNSRAVVGLSLSWFDSGT